MPIFESCMTILGATIGVATDLATAATLHGWFTGLKTGKQIEQIMNQQNAILNQQNATKAEVKKLSDHIYHADIEQVHNINGTSEKINDPRNLREILDPVQSCLNADILSTAVLSTPDKLREAFHRDPFEVLIETRPVNRAKKPTNPDLLPILFYEDGVYYIGWQTSGALPLLFGCSYSPDSSPDGSVRIDKSDPTPHPAQFGLTNPNPLNKNLPTASEWNLSLSHPEPL